MLYKEKINFYTKMTSKLGYTEEVLLKLILKIYSDPEISAEKESLKSTIQQ